MKMFIAAGWRNGMKNSVGPSFMYRIAWRALLTKRIYANEAEAEDVAKLSNFVLINILS